jgi:hypothetical protein
MVKDGIFGGVAWVSGIRGGEGHIEEDAYFAREKVVWKGNTP